MANAQIKIDDSSQDKAQNKSEISTSEKLTHKAMNQLTDYSITTIRSKASKGESIITRDGVTYHYDKNPKVLKWVRV
jgi:putative ATP-binding cassette transporter